ncbi:CARDB domain-containing protein [Chloroflexota bacterium]
MTCTGNYEAVLKINGITKETREITLTGGNKVTISFRLIEENGGTYSVGIGDLEGTLTVLPTVLPTPASFEVSSLTISPDEVDVGEKVDISVAVTNVGGSAGNYEVILNINTNIIDTKEIPLTGGTSEEVTFSTTADTPGKNIIEINGLLGSFTVKGEVTPTAQIPLPLEKPDVTLAPDEGPAPTSGINWWVIGIIAVGCVILAAGLLYSTWWRKRSTPSSTLPESHQD